MATYLITIQFPTVAREAIRLLDVSMQKENLVPVTAAVPGEKAFCYYGNQDIVCINEIVLRAAQISR